MNMADMNPFPDLRAPTSTNGGFKSVGKKSWTELHELVKDARKLQAKLTNMVPDLFTFRECDNKVRLYFLGVPSGRRDNTLMYCDINDDGTSTKWNQLLDISEPSDTASLSKEEQLLQERKRSSLKGLSSYSMHEQSGRFVFSASSKLHTCVDASFTASPLPVCTLNMKSEGSKLDPQICPTDPDLIAYVCNGDIWLYDMFSHTDTRLTYSRKKSVGGVQTVSSGLPSFIIQEEFNRYTGFWWQPVEASDGVYRIVYEEVDETDVDIISIASPTSELSGVEGYRYPRAGTTNATCRLKLLEILLGGPNRAELRVDSSILDLHSDIRLLYPWCEYIVQVGWCPDGQRVWVQLMDRSQTRLELVLIPLSYFVCKWNNSEQPPAVSPRTIIQETSDVWVNVDNCLHFLPCDEENFVKYIWASERTGYKHLYHCSVDLESEKESCVVLTWGEWQVASDHQVYVDDARNLIYFNANKYSPLESHLYCVSITTGHMQRLTAPGSHHRTLVNKSCTMVLSVFSSLNTNPTCSLYRIEHGAEDQIQLQISNIILSHSGLDPGYVPPQLVTCPFNQGRDEMYAMVYKPHNYRDGCKYPTILYVYGGPQVQMVVNSNRAIRLIRLHTLASLGYAVVCIDGRGSIGRGLQWESHIKNKMGMVEIADQVEGLQYLSSSLGFIDMKRVAIHGWSYGGYLSLMGLVQRPDIFKVSISGAPVTKWEYYDTGYTERYMSTPTQNPDGYKSGSVLNSIDKFPDQENRLLLIHGMIDENVHLVHTTSLVNELVKSCKPYRIQLYPNERHGIRNPEAGQHFETMVLSFLQDHL